MATRTTRLKTTIGGDRTIKYQGLLIAATIVALTVLASRAGAAISVTHGTLHADIAQTVSVPPYGGILTSTDKAFASPTTSVLAQFAPGYPLFAQEQVSFVDGQVGVSTRNRWADGQNSIAMASGSLDITEDEPETIWVRINTGPVGLSYRGQVSLDDLGGGNVFDTGLFTAGHQPSDFSFPLSPGQYTLTWSDEGRQKGSEYGGFDFTMSVPEPSGLLLVAASAPLFMPLRGRQR